MGRTWREHKHPERGMTHPTPHSERWEKQDSQPGLLCLDPWQGRAIAQAEYPNIVFLGILLKCIHILQWKWQKEILQGLVIFHNGWHWGSLVPWRREMKGWLSTRNIPACGPFNKCLVHLSGIKTDIWFANPIWQASPRLWSLAAGRHFVWCVRNQCKLPALTLTTTWLITNETFPFALMFQYRQSNPQRPGQLGECGDDPASHLILSA